MDEDLIKKPEKSKGDIVYAGAKSVLSVIPLVGGPLKELFSAIVAPPLAKRQTEWVESIAKGLVELHNKVDSFDIDTLSENKSFITTVTYATIIAIRNHKEMKREALRNAVLNSARGNAPDDDIQLMFLNFIDAFTPWHLRILMYYKDPKEWAKKNKITFPNWGSGSSAHGLEYAFPKLKNRREFYDQIIKDLHSRGLIITNNVHTGMSIYGILQSITTKMGKEFLAFIMV